MAAGQGQPASFDFAQPQHANLPCTRRRIGSTRLAGFLAFLVALRAVLDLFICAKYLFVAAIDGWGSPGLAPNRQIRT
jgi:hypothetical protein